MAFGWDDALLAVGSAVAGSLVKGFINRQNAEADFEDNARLRWQMWNANNRYNSPASVMQRYREAGLNPNLIYGQMPQASQPVAPTKETKPFSFEVNWLLKNQLENAELNNTLTRAEIANKLQQQKINDVAMANTKAQTALLKQRLITDMRSSNDAHVESRVRNAINTAILNDTTGNQGFWDKVGVIFGGSGEKGSGAPVRAGANFVGSLVKQVVGAYVNAHMKPVKYGLGLVAGKR